MRTKSGLKKVCLTLSTLPIAAHVYEALPLNLSQLVEYSDEASIFIFSKHQTAH